MRIEASIERRGNSWVIKYVDPVDAKVKDLAIRNSEADINAFAKDLILDEENNPIVDGEGNVKTAIWPFYVNG